MLVGVIFIWAVFIKQYGLMYHKDLICSSAALKSAGSGAVNAYFFPFQVGKPSLLGRGGLAWLIALKPKGLGLASTLGIL
jgi:hypothetical protein